MIISYSISLIRKACHELVQIRVQLLRVVEPVNVSLYELLLSLCMTNVEVEESAKMLQEWCFATEHDLVVDFTALEYYHLVVKRHVLVGGSHLVAHFNERSVVHHINFEFCV